MKRSAHARRAPRSRSRALGIDDPARRRRRGRPAGPAGTPFSFADGSTGAAPSATGSRCCRWRGGTAPTTARRPTSCAAAGARFGAERRQAGLGRRGRRRAPRRARQPEPARDRRQRPSTTSPRCARTWSTRTSQPSAHRRPGRRPAAHPLRPVRPARPKAAPEPRIAYHHPVLDRRVGVAADAPGAHRRRARRARRALRRRGRARRGRRASTSSTSSTATATCCHELLGARRPARRATAGSFEHRTAFLRDGRRRHPQPRSRAWRSACACRAFDFVPYRSRRRRRRRAGARRRARIRYAFGGDGTGPASRPRRAHRFLDAAGVELGIGLVCTHRRQPVLQPARPAAGVLPAVRRLPAARGSARRRRPADRGHRRL